MAIEFVEHVAQPREIVRIGALGIGRVARQLERLRPALGAEQRSRLGIARLVDQQVVPPDLGESGKRGVVAFGLVEQQAEHDDRLAIVGRGKARHLGKRDRDVQAAVANEADRDAEQDFGISAGRRADPIGYRLIGDEPRAAERE